MAKAKFENTKSLQDAKSKARGSISFRQMKDGRVIVAKWPSKKKQKVEEIIP